VLDIPRLERIRLNRQPSVQKFTGRILTANYGFLPGIEIAFEGQENLVGEPVIFAMNHTDRYNYFPFQYRMWKEYDRFTATWVKGKYYENSFVGTFMEKANNLPTVSRGYIISRDFLSAIDRVPSGDEYKALRGWVDAAAGGQGDSARPVSGLIPDALLTQPRNTLGRDFDPAKEEYVEYIDGVFHTMMRRFVSLNERAAEVGLDLLIFPQGTRSIRILPSHIGISQIALHLKLPIIPVGCSGCDKVYPGSLPWAKRGRIVYRFGRPIHYAELAPHHIEESFAPFSHEAEHRYRDRFEAVADLVTDRIEELVDPPYRRAGEGDAASTDGADRFL